MAKPAAAPRRVQRLTAPAAPPNAPDEPCCNGQRADLHGAAALWGGQRPFDRPGCQPLALAASPRPAAFSAARWLRRGFCRQKESRRWRLLQTALNQALEEMSVRNE